MATIDNLQIDINAQSARANDAIDRLSMKLERLTASLSKLEGSKLTGLANGVQKLSAAMQSMNNVKTSDFTRLASNLTKLSNINVSSLNSTASSMSHLTRAFNGIGEVSANVQGIGEMSKNISKLENKSVKNAIDNIPRLTTALNGFMTTISKSPKVSRNIIDMTNALANFSSQGSKVGSASRVIVKGMNNSSNAANRAEKSFGGLASAIGKFYAAYFLVVRGVKGLFKSIEETADYIEAFNYFNVSMNKIGKDWNNQYKKYGYKNAESYADSFGKRLNDSIKDLSGLTVEIGKDGKGILSESGVENLGLNIREITQYASQLASVTNSVGQTGEVSLAASRAFTKLAGDMSSLFNVDYKSVANNLQSGLIGQSRALYKYGIDITNATLQTYAYEMGLSKAVSEMTQAEKMQLRMIAILDQSKVAWGDLANTINSPSNMLRQFTNNLKETAMVLGQLFIPVLQKVMPVINGVVIAIKRLLVGIAELLGIKIDFGSFGQGYDNSFEEQSDDIDNVTSGYEEAEKAAKKYQNQILGFDQIHKLSSPETETEEQKNNNLNGQIDLTDEILNATAEYEKAWQEAFDRMENEANKWADKISKLLEPVMKIFKDFAVGDFFQAGQDVSNLVVSITDFFARAIDNVDWYGIGTKIGEFLAGIDWTAIFSSVGKLIWEALKAAIELWKGSFDAAPFETVFLSILALPGIVSFGGKLAKMIVGPFKNVYSLLRPVISGITSLLALPVPVLALTAAFAGLAAGLGYVFATNEEVRKSFSQAISTIREGLQPAIEFISDTVLPDLNAGWERLKEILSPLAEFLNDMFVSIWQDMINPALTYIGTTVLPKLTEAFENLWNNVLVPLGSFLADILEPVIEIVADVLSMLWKEVVVPLADAVGNVLGKAFEGLVDVFNFVCEKIKPVIEIFQFLWDNVLAPIVDFLWDILKPAFEDVFSGIGDVIKGLEKILVGTIDFIVGVFTGDWERAWNGVKDIFSGIWETLSSVIKMPLNAVIAIFEGLANKVIDAWNWIKSTINSLSFTLPSWLGGYSIGFNLGMSSHISIPRFETGGFPEDGLFMANRHELVGKFSNGKTAVANNEQIVDGIKAGVYEAVLSAFQTVNFGGGETIVNAVLKTENDEILARAVARGNDKMMRRYSPVL